MFKKILIFLLVLPILLLIIIGLSDFFVRSIGGKNIITDISSAPKKQTALVLGTSKYLSDGRRNLFYIYRIDATLELYKNDKINFVLVSGDNSRKNYDEPSMMRDDLVSGGIPVEKIFLDYAGFRTLDSVVRAREIFGQDDLYIISQTFHLERALTLAEFQGIKSLGYPAKDVPVSISPRVWLRERLARVKMWMDIATKKEPKILGEKIIIE